MMNYDKNYVKYVGIPAEQGRGKRQDSTGEASSNSVMMLFMRLCERRTDVQGGQGKSATRRIAHPVHTDLYACVCSFIRPDHTLNSSRVLYLSKDSL